MLLISVLLIVLVICFLIYAFYFYFRDNIKIKLLQNNNLNKYHDKISLFEKEMSHWYPLGGDEFRISHGNNYYTFFKRQGDLHILLAIVDNKVVGTIFGVLKGNKWYLADVKIKKKYRGKLLSIKMGLTAMHLLNKSNKIYGISMNNGEKNKLVEYAKKVSFGPNINFKYGGNLYIYSLTFDQLQKALPILTTYYNIGIVSLNGVKDLILKSTCEKMDILHLQFNKSNNKPIKSFLKLKLEFDKYKYMFCFYETNNIINKLNQIDINTDVTASLIHNNMDNYNWNLISTDEI